MGFLSSQTAQDLLALALGCRLRKQGRLWGEWASLSQKGRRGGGSASNQASPGPGDKGHPNQILGLASRAASPPCPSVADKWAFAPAWPRQFRHPGFRAVKQCHEELHELAKGYILKRRGLLCRSPSNLRGKPPAEASASWPAAHRPSAQLDAAQANALPIRTGLWLAPRPAWRHGNVSGLPAH